MPFIMVCRKVFSVFTQDNLSHFVQGLILDYYGLALGATFLRATFSPYLLELPLVIMISFTFRKYILHLFKPKSMDSNKVRIIKTITKNHSVTKNNCLLF